MKAMKSPKGEAAAAAAAAVPAVDALDIVLAVVAPVAPMRRRLLLRVLPSILVAGRVRDDGGCGGRAESKAGETPASVSKEAAAAATAAAAALFVGAWSTSTSEAEGGMAGAAAASLPARSLAALAFWRRSALVDFPIFGSVFCCEAKKSQDFAPTDH